MLFSISDDAFMDLKYFPINKMKTEEPPDAGGMKPSKYMLLVIASTLPSAMTLCIHPASCLLSPPNAVVKRRPEFINY